MPLDAAQCYQALTARDARFDGAFFVGVTSTGIYCRPVCPARTPRADRCRFFASAAAAERRNFRPCLRCRPELAPHPASAAVPDNIAPVDVVTVRARIAGARIASGALDGRALDELATELGVTARHLRRIVERELGASPIALAQTRRLLTAKQLLTDTALPMTQVALASGFQSVRRFNALFRARYRLAPGALRRSAAQRSREPESPADRITLSLGVQPPFDWLSLCEFFRTHAMPGVEAVRSGTTPEYWRTVHLDGHNGVLGIRAGAGAATVQVELSASLLPVLVPLLARVRHLLDLDATPSIIASQLREDVMLRTSVDAKPGLRVPGSLDAFELAVRAVLGQQVSVRGATTLAGRLVAVIAEPLPANGEITTAAPLSLSHRPLTAERLADASLDSVAAVGMPRTRAACLINLARVVAQGEFPLLSGALSGPPSAHAFEAHFTALPGIGRWTSQYVSMRALRSPDAFPDGDLALCKAAGGVTPAQLRRLAEQWRPWRAYAAMHLWASLS